MWPGVGRVGFNLPAGSRICSDSSSPGLFCFAQPTPSPTPSWRPFSDAWGLFGDASSGAWTTGILGAHESAKPTITPQPSKRSDPSSGPNAGSGTPADAAAGQDQDEVENDAIKDDNKAALPGAAGGAGAGSWLGKWRPARVSACVAGSFPKRALGTPDGRLTVHTLTTTADMNRNGEKATISASTSSSAIAAAAAGGEAGSKEPDGAHPRPRSVAESLSLISLLGLSSSLASTSASSDGSPSSPPTSASATTLTGPVVPVKPVALGAGSMATCVVSPGSPLIAIGFSTCLLTPSSASLVDPITSVVWVAQNGLVGQGSAAIVRPARPTTITAAVVGRKAAWAGSKDALVVTMQGSQQRIEMCPFAVTALAITTAPAMGETSSGGNDAGNHDHGLVEMAVSGHEDGSVRLWSLATLVSLFYFILF